MSSSILELSIRYADLATFIRNFRRGVSAGVPRSRESLRPITRYVHRQLEVMGAGFEYSEAKVEEAIERVVDHALTGSDAACIVFAHSALDALVSDSIRAVASVAPELWKARLSKRSVPLVDVEAKGYETIFQAVLSDDLGKLDRESLATRMGVLLERCPGSEGAEPPPDYKWDLRRLKEIDSLRHEIVHGGKLTATMDKERAEQDFDYLLDTGFYVLSVLKLAHGPKLLRVAPL